MQTTSSELDPTPVDISQIGLPVADRAEHDCAVGLGTSLGHRKRQLLTAILQLQAHPDVRIVRCSRLYRTPPMRGGTARGWFLNAVVRLHTTLDGPGLLTLVRSIEADAGRRRAGHWGDRTLDLDVLVHGDTVSDGPDLVLPHPGIRDRPFVLTPLLEVWPDAVDPRTQTPFATSPPPPPPRALAVGCIDRDWIVQPPAREAS